MELEKLSAQYYKVGTRKEPSETSKITKVSMIVLCYSLLFLIFNYILITTYGLKSFLLFTFFLSVVVFFLAIAFSFVMLFISKQSSDKIYLNMICYLLIALIIMMPIAGFAHMFDEIVTSFSSPDVEIVTEDLLYVFSKTNVFFIVAVIAEALFNFSMLVSFKVKDLKTNRVALACFIIYLLIIVVNVFHILFSVVEPIIVSLLLLVAWFICLYFVLEDKKVDVACIIHIDKNGEETQGE